jgi:SSS family solute:Na+ symporter
MKRASRSGAIACFVSGVFVSLFWLFFVHAKESKPLGLCKLLTGKDTLFPSLANVDAIIIALPIAAIVYVVVTLLTKPVEEEQVKKAFAGVENA